MSQRGFILPLIAVLIAALAGAVALFILKPIYQIDDIVYSPSPTPTITSDFPPLYPGVEWGEIKPGKYYFYNKENEILHLDGYRVEVEVAESETVDTDTQRFFKYYKDELETRGWIDTGSAGGPEGELYQYEKADNYFTFGYKALFSGQGPDADVIGYRLYIEYTNN